MSRFQGRNTTVEQSHLVHGGQEADWGTMMQAQGPETKVSLPWPMHIHPHPNPKPSNPLKASKPLKLKQFSLTLTPRPNQANNLRGLEWKQHANNYTIITQNSLIIEKYVVWREYWRRSGGRSGSGIITARAEKPLSSALQEHRKQELEVGLREQAESRMEISCVWSERGFWFYPYEKWVAVKEVSAVKWPVQILFDL